LFDLYQITNNQTAFDHLSLEYASKFETSPPVWQNSVQNTDASTSAEEGSTPSVTFPSQLDGSIIKLLEKLQNLSKQSKNLRLDFGRVKEVDPVGCGLLLRSLKNLKKTGHDLMLVGAQDFAEKIRAILEVGRRDETEAPWLLLLEILQLLHFESVFEETSIDYCITFEVSPPSFEAPKNKVTTMLPDIQAFDDISDRFMMPVVVEGKTENLIGQIAAHAEFNKLVLLDCSKLERVEFGASAQLLSGLVPIAGRKDTLIQFHDVNYLVMYLFNAMGLKNVAAIFPRKH
jgi:ABC-type transporter Mla MlaB component